MSLDKLQIAALIVLCAVNRSVSYAADFAPLTSNEAAARAKTLAPFIDEQTIAVARFDVSQISTDELPRFADLLWPGKRLDEGRGIAAFSEEFKKAGGSELYVVANLSDIPDRPPVLLVPLAKTADEK